VGRFFATRPTLFDARLVFAFVFIVPSYIFEKYPATGRQTWLKNHARTTTNWLTGLCGADTNAAYFSILETIPPKLWGSQSWLQPAFSRPLPGEGSLTSRKSRLKGGCGQDCPPHNEMQNHRRREKYAALD
jgi:hypothetical protein